MKMFSDFLYEEDGLGTIEIAIILAALVALAVVFKKQLVQLWNKIGGKAEDAANDFDSTNFEVATAAPSNP